jgi:signal transduction histidine kinase
MKPGQVVEQAGLHEQEQLAAIMAVSAAVAEGGELTDTLEQIAHAAAQLLKAQAAAIILRSEDSQTGLAVAGSCGLSDEYADYLNRIEPIEIGRGPSGVAVKTGKPVVMADVLEEPLFGPWRPVALREHYRAMVSMPLRTNDGEAIGVLNTYRAEPGPWTTHDVALLSVLADHAAIAIRTARLLDDSRRQVAGLSLMVRSLRAQAHEHSNRLHAIYGLLSMGEFEEARGLIATVENGYHSSYANVTARIANPTLAGLLVAETAIARESGIAVALDRRSRLSELPPRVSDLDAVTILGNLLHNAVEAVAAAPASRRRVRVRISEDNGSTLFHVRDWGPGIPAEDVTRMFEREATTKAGHAGIGLSIVRNIVSRAGGRIEVEHPRAGGLGVSVRFDG